MNDVLEILDYLKTFENKANQEAMKRFGIASETALGINIPILRNVSKLIKKNHEVSLELWQSDIHEAMILASMIAEPKKVDSQMMDAWTAKFYSWDLCDQVCKNLFQKTDFFIEKAFEYSFAKEEFVKRTGFVLMVEYTVHHKNKSDEMCLNFLNRIEEEAWDERNFVKKAVNWSLRQIGKRNKYLHPIALQTAYNIKQQNSKSAKWIAQNAIQELESEAVKRRLKL